MAHVTFRQDRQFAAEQFTIQENTLLVTGAAPPQRQIPLASISPGYERIERRFHRAYLVPLSLAVVFALGAWELFQGDPSMIRGITAGIVACMASAFPFMMKFTPVEGARFLDDTGVVLFEIYRPSKLAYTYDDFLSALVQRVKAKRRP